MHLQDITEIIWTQSFISWAAGHLAALIIFNEKLQNLSKIWILGTMGPQLRHLVHFSIHTTTVLLAVLHHTCFTLFNGKNLSGLMLMKYFLNSSRLNKRQEMWPMYTVQVVNSIFKATIYNSFRFTILIALSHLILHLIDHSECFGNSMHITQQFGYCLTIHILSYSQCVYCHSIWPTHRTRPGEQGAAVWSGAELRSHLGIHINHTDHSRSTSGMAKWGWECSFTLNQALCFCNAHVQKDASLYSYCPTSCKGKAVAGLFCFSYTGDMGSSLVL